MQIRVGTSGYSYREWEGSFYPQGLPAGERLRFYAQRFSTVEINNTYYRMPTRELLERWRGDVPAGFSFVLKASQRITHRKRLRGAGEELRYFVETAQSLGNQLGPLLFQLPPNLKRDLPRLADFLAELPQGIRAAFEFRHASWFVDDVYEALAARGAALCTADVDDSGEQQGPPLVASACWGYLRLRRSGYDDTELCAWLERIRARAWDETYVFFKHEGEGKGPAFAARLIALSRSDPAALEGS
jgi:uncharacterized protein YecE (DUF72 family)